MGRFRSHAKAALVTLVACSSPTLGCGSTAGTGAPGRVSGRLVDAKSGAPVAGAYVAIEVGGHYVANPDTSRANPAYQLGALSDADGRFAVSAPGGKIGIHTFFKDHFYGTMAATVDGDVTISLKTEPLKPTDLKPTISGAKIEPAVVSPGGTAVLSATVNAADPKKDPLSDEVIAIEPSTQWSGALAPPSPGVQGKAFPDGLWQRTIVAPSKPGTYTYGLAATTEACVTGDVVTLTLQVK